MAEINQVGLCMTGAIAGIVVALVRLRKRGKPGAATATVADASLTPARPVTPLPARRDAVWFEGETIKATTSWGSASDCGLDEVRVISVVVTPPWKGREAAGVSRVMNFRARGYGNCSFSLGAEGYDAVLAYVETLAGFDGSAYARALGSDQAARYPVWKRTLVIDAALDRRFSPAQARADFTAGPVLARDGDGRATTVLPWATRYDELARRPEVATSTDRYGGTVHRVRGPIWLGGLRVQELRVSVPYTQANKPPARTDVPVLRWSVDVVLSTDWEETYRLLQPYLVELFGAPGGWSYERADGKSQSWSFDGMLVQLYWWGNSVQACESGYCALSFENARAYPEFVTDTYTETLRLERVRYTVLPYKGSGKGEDFRRTRLARTTPPALRVLTETGWLVWVDRDGGRVGFADGAAAVVVERTALAWLELQNTAPAKGGGRAEVTLVEQDGATTRLLSGRYLQYDALPAELKAFAGIDVRVLAEQQDY